MSHPPDGSSHVVALYHMVYADEDFEKAAGMLVEVVAKAATEFPGKPRALYLDIEGHRNAAGGYDADMYELQKEFLIGFLMPYLTEAHIPLMQGQVVRNPQSQRDDLPPELIVVPPPARN